MYLVEVGSPLMCVFTVLRNIVCDEKFVFVIGQLGSAFLADEVRLGEN